MSTEKSAVPDAIANPVVSDTRRLPPTQYPDLHRADVSDSHDDRSQPVNPTLAAPLGSDGPNLDPAIVKLADPVSARFANRPPLTVARANVTPIVPLPVCTPPLITIRLLPLSTDAEDCRQVNDVSDSHEDPSHTVHPCKLDADIEEEGPIPRPCTVSRADPVLTPLWRRAALISPLSTECPALMLPVRCPADIDKRTLLVAHPPDMHRTAVSDTHPAVPSHADSPALPLTLSAYWPSMAPCTVTLDAPVVPALVRRNTLVDPKPTDRPAVTLPGTPPAVKDMRRLCTAPTPPRHRADVSDIQDVPSQLVAPILSCADPDLSPTPLPYTVTLVEPVAAMFTLSMPLIGP